MSLFVNELLRAATQTTTAKTRGGYHDEHTAKKHIRGFRCYRRLYTAACVILTVLPAVYLVVAAQTPLWATAYMFAVFVGVGLYCIFKRASDVTLNKKESLTSRTWFYLDELADAGKLNGLVSLAKKGRSKGACLVIAFQSISGLRDDSLYGQCGCDELLGQIGTRFAGRLKCISTADYVSNLLIDRQLWVLHEVDYFDPDPAYGFPHGIFLGRYPVSLLLLRLQIFSARRLSGPPGPRA